MSNGIERKIRYISMSCSLINLVLPISEAITIVQISSGVFAALQCLFFSLILSFIVWQANQHRHSFVDRSAKEALNFSLTIVLYITIVLTIWVGNCALVAVKIGIAINPPYNQSVSAAPDIVGLILQYGLYPIPALLFIHFWAIVFGSIQAARGYVYKYPFSIRFFR